MGLISETVKTRWNSSTKKHYEELGYTYTKMGEEFEVEVEDLLPNSEVEIKCICDNCGKELSPEYKDYRKSKRGNNIYCRKCSVLLFGIDKKCKNQLKKGKSFYDWCIENNRQDVLNRWDYELNNCSPKDILFKSHKNMWFKCLLHPEHKSELKNIANFTNASEGSIKCKQCNSIAQYILDNFPNKKLEEVWDYEKNGDSDPWEISRGNEKRVWIKCQEVWYHESYEVKCGNFCIKENRCPCCSHGSSKVHPLDSLKQDIVNNYGEEFFNIIWSNKNTIDPTTIRLKSEEVCWWNCPDGKHEPFKRSCNSSYCLEYRCSECSKEKEESILEEKVRLYLEELGYEVKTEWKCSLLIKNPRKDRGYFRFDNEIVLENGKHLIIEVHGEQHYRVDGLYTKTKEELHQRKLIDRYKRIKCIQAGYCYLELSYKTFDKKETYKKLIDNKIKEMLDK
ncbi:zinc-ribbon domain-containing protein [Clostridium sp.]|uniref:zinc-ribbon domain-containing protein n=1 Tax=Clostridium sp. TaxID=1506 RepID=UPI0025BB39B2|nr:zinc-ribbon domain-containing protein [Clostridium sp.]